MNHAANKQHGFTLIELMLAMVFLSVLLLAIALTIVQIGALYNKGITLKEVNQTSRDISDELRRTISASSGITIEDDYVTTTAGGRLCLGTYSYVWNDAKALDADDSTVTKYDGPSGADKIRLLKVRDTDKKYCAKTGDALTNRNILEIDIEKSQELLRPGERELALHQFKLVTPVPMPVSATNDTTLQQIYSFSFTIGTSDLTSLNADQTACLPPDDPNSNSLYCNVQQFSLVVRTL